MPDASTLPETKTSAPFVDFDASHIDEMVDLGARFFAESEFTEFAEFAPDHFRQALEGIVSSPASEGVLFMDMNGAIQGFCFFQLDVAYTKKPIALMWLLYVTPEYRKGPVGRCLLDICEGWASDLGATAFYAGAMAGIGRVTKTLRNMYTKAGYDELYWGRKILKEDDYD